LSLPRRLELLAWAQQTGALIIRDDYDSEYRYGSQPIPALRARSKRLSSLHRYFLKVLPSPADWLSGAAAEFGFSVYRAKWLSARQLPLLEHVLAGFIEEGHLERHIQQMRMLYDQRRQVLVQALNAHLGKRATILGKMLDSFDGAIAHFARSGNCPSCCLCWCGNDLAQPHYLKAIVQASLSLAILNSRSNNFRRASVDWLKFWWTSPRHANAISSSAC